MGGPFDCVWDAPRPFVHPLRSPSGAVLSVEAPADHPWHHGLWFTIKFVNGENFWEEYGEFGTLRTVRVEGDAASEVRAAIEWRRPSGDIVMREERTLTVSWIDDTAYTIEWSERLVPEVDVVLDRTPFTTWGGYGGLTLRGAPDFVDTSFTTPDGVHDRLLGERAPWCALDGVATRADGDVAEAGVLLVDHPANPRHPTPWYASNRADTYGDGWANFVNAAFLWHEPMELGAGSSLAVRYAVVVHDGRWPAARSAEVAESMWR
jgi:hypothetical protein